MEQLPLFSISDFLKYDKRTDDGFFLKYFSIRIVGTIFSEYLCFIMIPFCRKMPDT